MLESLLNAGSSSVLHFELSFDTAAIGSTALVATGAMGATFTRQVNTSTTGGVVNHATFGKCYYFDGNVKFVESAGKALNIYNRAYTMDIIYAVDKTTNAALINAGEYPSSVYPGWAFAMNQYPSTYQQLFMVAPGGAFDRLLIPGTNPGVTVLEHVTYKRTAAGVITGTNVRTGTSATSSYNPGAESILWIGGGRTENTSNFKGYLKSIVITLDN